MGVIVFQGLSIKLRARKSAAEGLALSLDGGIEKTRCSRKRKGSAPVVSRSRAQPPPNLTRAHPSLRSHILLSDSAACGKTTTPHTARRPRRTSTTPSSRLPRNQACRSSSTRPVLSAAPSTAARARVLRVMLVRREAYNKEARGMEETFSQQADGGRHSEREGLKGNRHYLKVCIVPYSYEEVLTAALQSWVSTSRIYAQSLLPS